MKIGNIELENPLFLAPMAGVSDLAFREICHDMGTACAVTEMVSAKALYYKNRGTEELLARSPKEGLLGVQLFGSEPQLMADMALTIEDRFDFIDINMGCPMPKIVNNGEGSALLLKPELVSSIVEAMVRTVHKPVTVKIRRGFDEDHVNAPEIARRLEAAGAAAIAVHGRTRSQYYSGKADRESIRLVKEAVQIPVIGNGDIWTAQDALDMQRETGCDGLMVARGAQGNPWLFREIRAALAGQPIPERPGRGEMAGVIRRHSESEIAQKGERVGCRELRKHLAWYTSGLPGGALLRREASEIATAEDLERWLEHFAG